MSKSGPNSPDRDDPQMTEVRAVAHRVFGRLVDDLSTEGRFKGWIASSRPSLPSRHRDHAIVIVSNRLTHMPLQARGRSRYIASCFCGNHDTRRRRRSPDVDGSKEFGAATTTLPMSQHRMTTTVEIAPEVRVRRRTVSYA